MRDSKLGRFARFCDASPCFFALCRMVRSRRRYAARNARLRLVNDNAGDCHGRVSAKHARFLFVDAKSFVLGNVPNSGQEVANSLFRFGVGDRREGQVVSVSGVLPAELCRNAGQPRVEPAGDEIGKGRACASALRQPVRRWRREKSCRHTRQFAAAIRCRARARIVAAAGRITQVLDAPRTRWNVMDGKKFCRSTLTSTCRAVCSTALVRIDRLVTKPCAAACVARR